MLQIYKFLLIIYKIMKKNFTLLILMILSGLAVMGGVALVLQNQNIWRKATVSQAVFSLLPDRKDVSKGEKFTLKLLVNTGDSKLKSVVAGICYDQRLTFSGLSSTSNVFSFSNVKDVANQGDKKCLVFTGASSGGFSSSIAEVTKF